MVHTVRLLVCNDGQRKYAFSSPFGCYEAGDGEDGESEVGSRNRDPCCLMALGHYSCFFK